MTYAIIAAVIIMMSPQGLKKFPVVFQMAHGKPFATKEACDKWMNKTGYDTADIWETEVEKNPPLVVLDYKVSCSIPGKEV